MDGYPKTTHLQLRNCRRLWSEGMIGRLNEMKLEQDPNLELVESRVERLPTAVRITHIFQYKPSQTRLQTEPYTGYE